MLKLKALIDALKFWKKESFPDATLTLMFPGNTVQIPIPFDSPECKDVLIELVRALMIQRREDKLAQLIDDTATIALSPEPPEPPEPPSTTQLLNKHEEWLKQRDQQQRDQSDQSVKDAKFAFADGAGIVFRKPGVPTRKEIYRMLKERSLRLQSEDTPVNLLADWANDLPPELKRNFALVADQGLLEIYAFFKSMKGTSYEAPPVIPGERLNALARAWKGSYEVSTHN